MTGAVRAVVLPEFAVAALQAHRAAPAAFRLQRGTDYRTDLDLIFANPAGTLLRPDSISAAVSALFKKLKLPKGREPAYTPPFPGLSPPRRGDGITGGIRATWPQFRLSHGLQFIHIESKGLMKVARRWKEFQRKSNSEGNSLGRTV
jgi:hypothetical protein